MHFISWFIMVGILIGGLITKQYMSILAACVGMGLCSITDGIYFFAKTITKEDSENDEAGND